MKPVRFAFCTCPAAITTKCTTPFMHWFGHLHEVKYNNTCVKGNQTLPKFAGETLIFFQVF